MAKTVPLDNPRECPNAFLWDSMTFHTWIEQNVWLDHVKKILELAVRTVIGCETNEVSFLFFLWYIHHNHGF
jgi:monoamine oxidase